MQKLSFIKGLFIAGVFSSMFWIGIYYAVSNDSPVSLEEETIQNIEQPEKEMELVATKASL